VLLTLPSSQDCNMREENGLAIGVTFVSLNILGRMWQAFAWGRYLYAGHFMNRFLVPALSWSNLLTRKHQCLLETVIGSMRRISGILLRSESLCPSKNSYVEILTPKW
jgi:hypothetical protein